MRPRQGIKGAKGFIQQQHFRFHRQRPGNANALLHPTGDLPRTLVQGVAHLYPLEVVLNPLFALAFAHAATKDLVHRQRHVVKAGQPRQQGVVLKHHRAFRPRPGDFAVVAQQAALRRQGYPGYQIQQG